MYQDTKYLRIQLVQKQRKTHTRVRHKMNANVFSSYPPTEGGKPTWDMVRNRDATDLGEHHKQKERNHVRTVLPRMIRSGPIHILFAERS